MKVRAYWKEAELKRVEDICKRVWFQRKLLALLRVFRRLSEGLLQGLSSFIALKNFRGILQIAL